MGKNRRSNGIRSTDIAIAGIMLVAGFAAFAQAGLLDGLVAEDAPLSAPCRAL